MRQALSRNPAGIGCHGSNRRLRNASLASHLQGEGFGVAIVNPRRIRDFARALGQMAKTDKIDARIIAKFAATLEPMPHELISR